jgi:hypothetical protein
MAMTASLDDAADLAVPGAQHAGHRRDDPVTERLLV